MLSRLRIVDESFSLKKNELMTFFEEVNYNPPINEDVDLEKYTLKLINKANIVVLREENKLVGLCAFYCNSLEAQKGFISSIGLLKEYQGRGLSEKLLKAVIEVSTNKEMRSLFLEVFSGNKRAISFYKKNSFVIVDSFIKYSKKGEKRCWYLMKKKL